MSELFFQNIKTGKRYKIVSFNKEQGTVKLQGPHATWEEPYSKERFQQLGYTLVKEDAAPQAQAG